MPYFYTYIKKVHFLILFAWPFPLLLKAQTDKKTYKLTKIITGKLSPKSINNNGKNMFFAQNMMYNHTVTVYDSTFNLVATINDKVKPADFGFEKIKGTLTGAPVESAATKDGKYVWVSNYNMEGDGYSNPGCDTCNGKGYDQSFVYKINTQGLKIESIVKVGSVPKFLAITPDQKKLIVSNWSSGDVSIIDLVTEKELKRINVGPAPRGIACDTGSTFAYVAIMGAWKIVKINLTTYETETFVSGIRNPRHLCIDKDYLYASLNGEQAVCRINLLTARIEKLTVGKAPRSMVISPVYHKLFVDCYEDSKIAVVDLTTFKPETDIKCGKYPIGVCLSNDNKQVLVSCYTGYIEVFSEEKANINKVVPVAVTAKKENNTNSSPVLPGKKNLLQSILPVAITLAAIQKPLDQKNQGNCYIVLGCFSVKENALNLKDKLLKKGVAVELIDTKKGITYCAYRTSKDNDRYEKQMVELEAITGIKGWLYEI